MQTQPLTNVLALYEALLLPRVIELKMLKLIRQGRLSKWFSGEGQEAIAVGVTEALNDNDYILPMHRNLGVWTSRRVPLKQLFCQLMGRQGGFTKGRDRTFHFGIPERNIVGMISQLAAMLPVADGLALAAKLDNSEQVAAAFIGDGATREGDFHEALSLAATWSLPVLFIVENNGYGLSTPVSEAVPIENIADAALGYGMSSAIVDGNDLLAVIDAVQKAARYAREGRGPTLLEMKTFRIRGHEEASGTKYVPPDLIEEWKGRDPIDTFSNRILDEVSEKQQAAIRKRLVSQIEEVAEWAITQPLVRSTLDQELSDVFAVPPGVDAPDALGPGASVVQGNGEVDHERTSPARETVEKRFIDAISDGLRDAMDEDPKVLLMGQDIAEYGGVFKVTAGFLDRFGQSRVRNTPIMESGIIGAAMGLALAGWKPVVEMQYGDFITCGFNQIVNNLSTTHYRWNAALNVTIRAPFGGGIGAGPFHSQSMEAWFCHVPGLKVVIPATPSDAKGLLRSAIDDPNPVLFFEHKKLYRSLRGQVPDGSYRIPLGKAAIAREGEHATIVTYGIGVAWAKEVADEFARTGHQIEIVDLRTLIPWDRDTVLQSVRKTNRLLVLHEAVRTGGFGGEILSEIAEDAFDELDAPPVRIGAEDLPAPFSAQLEEEIYSARSRLKNALEKLLNY